ncbi:MAG: CDP-alcohol phosphatidyltransferase family protein [Verrucomicrobia bacterium]|nr:CDP-alcohol phosphatidyltransferase family protein [Verrucomicrobiota bacterium]
MRRVYLLPNLITTFSLACGLFVIFRMSMITPGMASYPFVLVSCLMLLLAAIADVLDGATARLIRAESDFGVVFDSLSDGITFGVAPAVLTLKTVSLDPENKISLLLTTGAMLFAVCGVLRLVRYSVNKRAGSKDEGPFFIGLPIPAAAAAIASATLLLASPQLEEFIVMSDPTRGVILSALLLLVGYFMVSRWKFPGIRFLNFRPWSYNLIFLTVALSVAIFYGILRYFPFVFAGLSWGYILTSWALSIIRILTGKKVASLASFDPDEEAPVLADPIE